jgi:hypothetical protein
MTWRGERRDAGRRRGKHFCLTRLKPTTRASSFQAKDASFSQRPRPRWTSSQHPNQPTPSHQALDLVALSPSPKASLTLLALVLETTTARRLTPRLARPSSSIMANTLLFFALWRTTQLTQPTAVVLAFFQVRANSEPAGAMNPLLASYQTRSSPSLRIGRPTRRSSFTVRTPRSTRLVGRIRSRSLTETGSPVQKESSACLLFLLNRVESAGR